MRKSGKSKQTKFTPHCLNERCADKGFPQRQKPEKAEGLEARLMQIDKLKASLGQLSA